MPTHRSAKLAAAAAVATGGLTLAAGLAVAVDLPDQASDTAEERVAEVHDTTTTSSTTSSTATTTTTAATTTTVDTEADDVAAQGEGARPTDTHGYVISNLARSTEPGPDHGATVSAAASGNATNGTATAEEHRSAEHGKSAEHRPSNDG